MTKLIAHMFPGVFLIVVFSLLKAYVIPAQTTFESWFVYVNFFVWIVCIVVPCVIYYLRTPPGIDHRE
jgi:hypothetical protein